MEGKWHVEALTREQCLELLESTELGRIVVMERGLPIVCSVRFRVRPQGIVFRLRGDARLRSHLGGTVVAFHADLYDAERGRCWSVLVHGVATEATHGEVATPEDEEFWDLQEAGDHLVLIPITVVSGEVVQFPV